MDFTILGTIFVLLCLYGAWRGRGNLLSLLVALYPAIVLYDIFPYTSKLIFWKKTPFEASFSHLIIFVVLLAIVLFGFRKVLSHHSSYSGGFGTIAILGLVGTGFLVALSYHLPGLTNLHNFSPSIDQFFASGWAYFGWLLVVIIISLLT